MKKSEKVDPVGSIALVGAGGGGRVVVWFTCHLYLRQTSPTVMLLVIQCLLGVTNFSAWRGSTQVGKCEASQCGRHPHAFDLKTFMVTCFEVPASADRMCLWASLGLQSTICTS